MINNKEKILELIREAMKSGRKMVIVPTLGKVETRLYDLQDFLELELNKEVLITTSRWKLIIDKNGLADQVRGTESEDPQFYIINWHDKYSMPVFGATGGARPVKQPSMSAYTSYPSKP